MHRIANDAHRMARHQSVAHQSRAGGSDCVEHNKAMLNDNFAIMSNLAKLSILPKDASVLLAPSFGIKHGRRCHQNRLAQRAFLLKLTNEILSETV